MLQAWSSSTLQRLLAFKAPANRRQTTKGVAILISGQFIMAGATRLETLPKAWLTHTIQGIAYTQFEAQGARHDGSHTQTKKSALTSCKC
eukprot:1160552-Pelagomonas_calceolata.AAC.3